MIEIHIYPIKKRIAKFIGRRCDLQDERCDDCPATDTLQSGDENS